MKTIFKIPQEPTGMTYLAAFTIPFNRCSYVAKIQAPKVDTTGIRDAVIANTLIDEGKITIGDNGYENWFNAPYDKNNMEGTRMNASEDSKYDIEFPDHPLSKARHILSEIEQKIQFKSEVEKLSKFDN